jgi:hypothetical protein
VVIQSLTSRLIRSQAEHLEWMVELKAQNMIEEIDKVHLSVQAIVQMLEVRTLLKNPWIFTPQDADLWTQELIKCYETYVHRI